MAGDLITVYGDGKQTRCFTDVSDSVRAITLLAKDKASIGEVFNIGNPANKITLNALASKIKKMTGSDSKIIHVPYDKAFEKGFEDMRHRQPDITKLTKLVGFKPRVKIDALLRNIIISLRA
jgi:UDP-glucose 4-epimerase